MDTVPKKAVGPLDGKFEYKTNKNGTLNKQAVICTLCKKEFSFHRSTCSLKYHISAKHAFVGASSSGASPGLLQTTLTEHQALNKSISEHLTKKNCQMD